MRRAFVSTGLLLLCCSTTAFASPPADLPSFLASLASGGSCPAPMQAASRKDPGGGGVTALAYCEADCGSYNVSCSGGTCSAVDRNCSVGQRGYVQCDGATTYCADCGCPEGHVQWWESGCCPGGYLKYRIYECINGAWQQVDTFCDSISCY